MKETDRHLLDFANTQNNASEKLLKIVRDLLPFAVVIISMATTFIIRIFEIGFRNPFSPAFFVQLGTNILTTMATYVCFLAYGNSAFKATNSSYINNIKTWSDYSTDIRQNASVEFCEYCRDYERTVVENKRRERLERLCMIPYEVYKEKYRSLSREKLDALVKAGEISKREKQAILWASAPVRQTRIEAVAILCGSDSVRVERIAANKRNYALKSVVARPFSMLLISAMMSFLTSRWVGISTADVFFSIVYSCALIFFAGISGNSAGNANARREAADVKSRIFFIDGFRASRKEKADE